MTNTQACRWRIFSDPAELRDAAVKITLESAAKAIAERGRFDIVLAGGTTPRAIYEQLRRAESEWRHWHVWFGDERCLPADNVERNSLMASQALLDHVAIAPEQIHPIPAELGASAAAAAYNNALDGMGPFDLVLLGVGEDGHTASLFPGHRWDHVPPKAAIPVHNSPKPPSDRVSLSADRLSDARQVIFLVTGAGKRHAVEQWRGNTSLPVKAIVPKAGVDVFMDAAAGGAL
ncbi:MAG TPA: 6-phosphogluconolactonase [Novimethylophilus sp.]|jgi:6-phosphogluconolactonase|uniref:6-phosphogluconolactonase n=1 Tax=Novimethylophilus sp. TaxID=2137426 RepID=UPI002F3F06BB